MHHFNFKHDYFQNYFFPSTIFEWNNLESNVKEFWEFGVFEKRIWDFIRLSVNIIFYSYNSKDLKLITWLKVELLHLRFHKFKCRFQKIVNPNCDCSTLEKTVP